jgi:hypothetical protein
MTGPRSTAIGGQPRRAPWTAGLLLLTSTMAIAAAGDDLKVTPVVADGRVLASFNAAQAWTPEAREVAQTGLALTFTFDVELRRPSAVWFDSTLAHVVVASSVRLEALTGSYHLSRFRDGRVVKSDSSRDERQAREWMTTFDQVPLEPTQPLEPNVEYYVRVRLYASPKRTFSLWSLWPWSRDSSSGRASFTFMR